MKDIHIPTIEELLRPDEFDIERITGGYRISGIQYHRPNRTFDLATVLMPGRTQKELAEHASNAGTQEYKAASAPLYHAIFKTLYRNRDRREVEEVRKILASAFKNYRLYTLSNVMYIAAGTDIIVHNLFGNKEIIPENTMGPNGPILNPATNAIKACKAVLEDDNLLEINNIYRWITEKDTNLVRPIIPPTEKFERPVILGAFTPQYFTINLLVNDAGLAIGVRLVK